MAAKPNRRVARPVDAAARTTAARRAPRRRDTELDLRRAPLQSRGQATFDHILDATSQLLAEFGFEGVNTNTIAKAAGVNIATLYQYFPNKRAVLLALFQRQAQRRLSVAQSLLAGIGRSADWPARIDAFVDGMARLRAELPGTAALMQAMRVDPELREYNLRVGDAASAALAEELIAAGKLSREDARIVARCMLEVNAALIDVWQQAFGGRNARLLGELKQLHTRYLAAYLPDPATPKRRGAARAPAPRAK
jgi:AcrR family transcriptional regulator